MSAALFSRSSGSLRFATFWRISGQIVCVKFCKKAVTWLGLSSFSELYFLVLLEVIHVEVSVCLKPVLVGFDGESSNEASAGV